jgi:hypothetical protein
VNNRIHIVHESECKKLIGNVVNELLSLMPKFLDDRERPVSL